MTLPKSTLHHFTVYRHLSASTCRLRSRIGPVSDSTNISTYIRHTLRDTCGSKCIFGSIRFSHALTTHMSLDHLQRMLLCTKQGCWCIHLYNRHKPGIEVEMRCNENNREQQTGPMSYFKAFMSSMKSYDPYEARHVNKTRKG